MKTIFLNLFYAASALVLTLGGTACNDDNGGDSSLPESEESLKAAVEEYVDNTVVPTYRDLADASIELTKACEQMLEKWGPAQANAGMTTADITAAGQQWKDSRLYWELSEAWLFGAAEDYHIDPHIDTWPLDATSLQRILDTPSIMTSIEQNPGLAGTMFGEGILGFHSLEYMLFENGQARSLDKYTRAQLVFMVAIATDLRNQCIILEASWGGVDAISEEKAEILGEEELLVSFDYGRSMKNAGQVGSRYSSYASAADEIMQGAMDIADEVGGQKIGRPALFGEYSYVESPYSWNSQVDFADNIRSVQHAYQGMEEGRPSISDYVKKVNPELDTRCRNAIATAIAKIESAPAPFVNKYQDDAWDAASEYCSKDLMDALSAVQALLTK